MELQKELYNVKETANISGLSEHTIRYYSNLGLIPTIQRNENKNRMFNQECLNWLKMIKCLRETGMNLQDIKKYIDLCLEGDNTINERYEIILKQRLIVKEQLQAAKERMDFMDKKVNFYEDIIKNQKQDMMNPQNWNKK